jgi:hypothetical protein
VNTESDSRKAENLSVEELEACFDALADELDLPPLPSSAIHPQQFLASSQQWP